MNSIHVSSDIRDYIRRLVLEADTCIGVDYSKRCQTARVLDASIELENLAKMKAHSLGHTFIGPDEVKAMAVYVIARRHANYDLNPFMIIDSVPVIEPKTAFVRAWSACTQSGVGQQQQSVS